MISFFVIMLIVMYFISALCAGLYFDGYPFLKIIYLIAAITPIWNTYLSFKYITKNYSSFKEAIKYHFTWEK